MCSIGSSARPAERGIRIRRARPGSPPTTRRACRRPGRPAAPRCRAGARGGAHTVWGYAGMPAFAGAFAAGPGATALFDRPAAIAVAPEGALFVADMHNCRIRRVDAGAGHAVTTWAGTTLGFADGP